MAETTRLTSAQNSGNPVLDSLVNLVATGQVEVSGSAIVALHKIILELAEKEPGGLKSLGKKLD